jgi:hypothetical protein
VYVRIYAGYRRQRGAREARLFARCQPAAAAHIRKL